MKIWGPSWKYQHHDYMILEDSPSTACGSNNILVLNEHPNWLVLYFHKARPFPVLCKGASAILKRVGPLLVLVLIVAMYLRSRKACLVALLYWHCIHFLSLEFPRSIENELNTRCTTLYYVLVTLPILAVCLHLARNASVLQCQAVWLQTPDHISSQQNGGQKWASDEVSECVCLCGQTMNGMLAAATEGFLPVYDASGSCSISWTSMLQGGEGMSVCDNITAAMPTGSYIHWCSWEAWNLFYQLMLSSYAHTARLDTW